MAKNDDENNVEQQEEEKKPKKEKKAEDGSGEEGTGSKIVSILIVLIIVTIWLGIFAVLVKSDVQGFGSMLKPVLKDVPIVNQILPKDNYKSDEEGYNYTLDEAIDRIKELEMQLDSQSSTNGVDNNYIEQLEAEVKRLQEFEKMQTDFAKKKKEFDEEVVYADNAPDIEEYKSYYEQINPDNAAEIYRQVVEQVQYDEKVKETADRYAQMDASAAARILDEMTAADLDLVCAILDQMDAEKGGAILAAMDSNVAAKITKKMNSRD